jgi:hypothetical protein
MSLHTALVVVCDGWVGWLIQIGPDVHLTAQTVQCAVRDFVQSRTTGTGRSCTKGGTLRCLARYDFLGVRLTSTVQLYRVEASPIFPPINLTQDVIDVKGSSKGGGQVGGNWRSHRAGRGRELQGTTLIGQLAQFGSCDRSRPVFVLPVTECYALFTHTHTGFVCGWHSWVASSRRARLSQEKRSMRYVNPKNSKISERGSLPPSQNNLEWDLAHARIYTDAHTCGTRDGMMLAMTDVGPHRTCAHSLALTLALCCAVQSPMAAKATQAAEDAV